MSDFALTNGDKASEAWRRLKAHLKQLRNELREKNDNPADERSTAYLRGQIAQLNEILALDPERE